MVDNFLTTRHLTVIIGPGLQGEQRVDVDWSDPQALLGGVVGITQGSHPVSLHGVGRISSVAGLGLGQTEGYSDVWLELSGGGGGPDQVGQVAEYSLNRKTSSSVSLHNSSPYLCSINFAEIDK